MIIFDLFEDANKKPQGVTEAEGPDRVDPILYKALARMTKGGYDDAKIALAIEFGLLDMKHNYAIANNYIPKLVDLYNQKHGVAEGQYEIHHLDPEGRRKAIYHHGKGYTDDVVRKDTQYHQERNPRDTFRVFKDKQPFDWQGVTEMDKSQKSPAGWNLDDYDYSKGKWTRGKIVTAKDAVKDMGKELNRAFNNPDPKDKEPGVKESLEDHERYQYIVTLKSGKRIRFLCGADCDVKTYIERKYNEPVVDIKDQGIVGEPPVELLPGEIKEGSQSFHNGMQVKLTPEYADRPDEVFTVAHCDRERGRCWIGDEQGRGWYASFDQLIPVEDDEDDEVDEGEVTKTATGMRHRSTDAYGGTPREPDPLRTLDKATTNKLDQALGVKYNREKKWGGGLDLTNEVSPEYIERYKKEHGKRATAADQAGDYAKGHEHFKKINKLTKQQFQRGNKPEKVDEISNFMTQPTKPVSPEEQWKRQIRLLAKQYQTNAGSLAALARENGADSAEAVAYEYLRDPSKIRVPGTAAPVSAVNWDEVIRRLPMGLSGMALLQAAEEYLINNRGMLRSTVRSLLNNDENQRTLSAAYAKKKTPAESVTEESDNEAVEQAVIRRIMVGRTDLLLKYGPKKVMQAVEEVADYVGAVDEIGSSDVSGWVAQVERTLGGMSEAKATSTRLDPKCWTGKKIGNPKTKVKGGVRVNNCVPAESVAEDLTEEFNLIESIIELLAEHNGVDAEVIWEDLETLTEDELYVFAVTSKPIMESQGVAEDWQKANKRDKTDGMSQKAVNAYRRENPGSKLKTAVTTKPSKLKKGSKASKRRKSYCSRSKGQMNMHNISCAKTPDKAICKARRRWNC